MGGGPSFEEEVRQQEKQLKHLSFHLTGLMQIEMAKIAQCEKRLLRLTQAGKARHEVQKNLVAGQISISELEVQQLQREASEVQRTRMLLRQVSSKQQLDQAMIKLNTSCKRHLNTVETHKDTMDNLNENLLTQDINHLRSQNVLRGHEARRTDDLADFVDATAASPLVQTVLAETRDEQAANDVVQDLRQLPAPPAAAPPTSAPLDLQRFRDALR